METNKPEAPTVNVLGVLDVRRHLCVKQSTKNANAAFLDWRDWCNYLPEADNARAAVVELIAALRHARKKLDDEGYFPDEVIEAALARVEGAA